MFLVYVCKGNKFICSVQIFSAKKFIYSFIFNLYIQINSLNLHIFANKLIYCVFTLFNSGSLLLYCIPYYIYRKKTVRLHHLVGAAAYCKPDPGRRASGSRFRAAGVSRLNEGSRVFPEIGISLIINYLSSPLGR